MIQTINKKLRNRKGFTLVELIVVIAVLGILAGIAVPKVSGIITSSKIAADAATATTIVKSARLIEVQKGKPVTNSDSAGVAPKEVANTSVAWDSNIMDWPTAQNAETNKGFLLSKVDGKYQVTWTPVGGSEETVKEGEKFDSEND